MKYLDEFDCRFIDENCPDELVPVFITKTQRKYFDMHRIVKNIYSLAERTMGQKIDKHTTIGRIVDKESEKDEYLFVYYSTVEERAAVNNERQRLMYLNCSNPQPKGTVCCSFNDKNQPIDAFSMPIGKIKSDKDVNKIIDDIKEYLAESIRLHAIPDGKNTYLVSVCCGNETGRGNRIAQFREARILIQAALLKNFTDEEILFCDANGNDYQQGEQRAIITELADAKPKYVGKTLVLLPNYLAALQSANDPNNKLTNIKNALANAQKNAKNTLAKEQTSELAKEQNNAPAKE